MCRAKRGAKPVENIEHEDGISNTLCPIISVGNPKRASVDHHMFDKFTKGWLRRRSKSQPYVRQQVKVKREDYNHFGFPLRVPQAHSFVTAKTDKGCQSCLAGLKVINKLGISVEDLIPVSIKIRAANNDDISILGATMLRNFQEGIMRESSHLPGKWCA